MATKLEWVHLIDAQDGDRWDSGRWQIMVSPDHGRFFIWDCQAKENPTDEFFPTLADAKAYCESQEEQPAAPQPQPQPGSVWGVPGKPETWRRVNDANDSWVEYWHFDYEENSNIMPDEWQSWVRETGAVDLIADRERLAAELEAVKELEIDALTHFNQCGVNAELAAMAGAERDALRVANERLEIERKDLQTRLESYIHCVPRGVYVTDLQAARERLETLEKQYQAAEDAVATHFQVSVSAAKERDEALKKLAAVEQERDEAELRRRDLWDAKERMEVQRNEAVRLERLALNVADSMAKERDAARAAVSRLLEALRGIAATSAHTSTASTALDSMERQAREAIRREEGAFIDKTTANER